MYWNGWDISVFNVTSAVGWRRGGKPILLKLLHLLPQKSQIYLHLKGRQPIRGILFPTLLTQIVHLSIQPILKVTILQVKNLLYYHPKRVKVKKLPLLDLLLRIILPERFVEDVFIIPLEVTFCCENYS